MCVYTKYAQLLTTPPISFSILHCSALILLNAMKQSDGGTDTLRYLHLILNQPQLTKSDGSDSLPGHAFLNSVRHIAMRKPLNTGTSSYMPVPGNSSAQFEKFSGSLLGWVLFKGYYGVAREWAKDIGMNVPTDNIALEAWFLPRNVIKDGYRELVLLWLCSGLATGLHTAWVPCAASVPRGLGINDGAVANCNCNNRGDKSNATILHYAAASGQQGVFKLLVGRVDVDADLEASNGQTSLSWAAEHGRNDIVWLLLEREDVDADSKDKNGQTPLLWATKKGHEAVVRLLVEREDVDVNSKDECGRTPLLWAAISGHEAVVRLLVEREDVDAESKDGFGQTPLYGQQRMGMREL